MGKNFAHKLANLLLTFVMICSCLFVFSACKKDDDATAPTKATITSISVDVAESSSYTMVEKTIEVNYSSDKRYRFEASDFVVTATKSDSTTEVLSQKTETADGYTLDSTVSTATPTPVNEYKLTFGYTGVESVEIKVKVNKGVIDVSGVTLESKTYNGSAQTLTTADIKNLPENVTAEFVSGNSGTDAMAYEAELSFTYTGDDAENFETIPNRTISWNINKANYNVSGLSWNVYQGDTAVTDVNNIVYNGVAYTAKISGTFPAGLTVESIEGYNEFATQTGAGTYTATVQFNFNINYNAPEVPAYTYTIKKANLTVTANDKEIYFTDEASNNGTTYSGFVTGENESTDGVIKGELSFSYSGKLNGTQTHKAYQVGSSVGEYPIVPAGISADNYEITFVNGILTVKAKTYNYSNLNIEFNYSSESPFTYNGQIQRPTVTGVPTYVYYSVAVTAGGETVTNPKDAGTYTGTFTPDVSSGNYTFTGTAPTVEYVIGKKALTITANDKTINFGEEKANAGVSLTGLVTGEVLADVTTGKLEYSYVGYEKTSPAGTYVISVSGLSSTNYEITYANGTLTVVKIQLNYSIITIEGTETVIYDGEVHTFSVKGKPDYVQATLVYKNSNNDVVSSPKDAGTYTVTFTVTANNNYEFLGTAPTKTLVISKKALTITAENKEITWGDVAPTYTATYSGFVTGETKDTEGVFTGTLSFDSAYTAGSNAGTYDIVPKGLSAKNYEISFVKGTLTVKKVTYNYSDLAWKLNGEDVILESGGFAKFEYTGQAQKPTVSGLNSNVSYTVTYNNYNFSEKTVGTEIQNPTVVGDYIATLAITASDNYEFNGTFAPLVYGITKKNLTEADKAKIGFVVKKVNKTDSTDVETLTLESITDVVGGYSLTAYLEQGYEYLISFKNEFDANITFSFTQNDGENEQNIDSLIGENNARSFDSICDYTFTATAGGDVLQYYVGYNSSYTLKFSIESIIKEIGVFYLNNYYDSIDSGSKKYESMYESLNNYATTTIYVNNLLTDIIAVFSDDDGKNPSQIENNYNCEFAIDAENTTAVDVKDYSNFENVIYLIIRRKDTSIPAGPIVGVYPIKVNLNISLTTSNSADHTISVSSTGSNITTSENPFALDLTSGDKTVIEALGGSSSVKLEKYTDDETLSGESVSSVTLESGKNKLRIYISFTLKISDTRSETYSYKTDIAVICSVSSDYFNVSYGEEGQQSEAYDNSLYVNVYGISDFTGENATSLTEIVNGISISSKSQDDLGEESKTYDVDEDSKTVECVNGKVYVVFDVTENEAQGGGSSSEDEGDLNNPSDPEPTELSKYRSISLYADPADISKAKKLYILLNLPFDVDYNTNATFTKDIKDDKIDADKKTIEMVEYECLYITLENENAIIELKNNATNEIRYILTYGSNTTYEYFYKVGTYTLTIKPTICILSDYIQDSLESHYNVWNITVTEYVPEGSTGNDDYDKEMFFNDDLYPLYPRFDFNDHIDTSITKIEIKVNDKTYTLEDGDVYYDDNIYTVTIGDATYDRKLYKEFLVRSTDKLSVIKDAQTGKVTIQSFTLEGWGDIELYYLETSASNSTDSGDNGNDQISNFVKITESSFALSVVSHYEFGDTVEFYIKKGSDYYKFTVVFDDSFPTFDGINPYTKSKPDSLDKFSITFKDKNGNSHTYSTDTDNFYYNHFEGTVNNVYQYEMYARMDIETSDVTSHLYKVGTSDEEAKFLDCEDITFKFADDGLFADATFETYMWYKNSNYYVHYSETRIVDEHLISSWGECLELTAKFTVGSGDDAETYIWTVYLIFKNSMPIPNEPDETDEKVSYFSSYIEGIAGDDKHKGFGIDCAIDEDANLVGDFILTDSDPGKMLEFTAYIGEDKLAYTTTTGEGADAVTMLEFNGIMLNASVVKTTYMIDCNKETNNQIELTTMEYEKVNYLVAMSPKFVVKDNQIKIKVINNEGEDYESVYYFIIVFGDNPNGSGGSSSVVTPANPSGPNDEDEYLNLLDVAKFDGQGYEEENLIFELVSVVNLNAEEGESDYNGDFENESSDPNDGNPIETFVAYVNSSLLESGATTYILDYVLLGEYVTENMSAIKILDGNKTENNEITIEDITLGTETIKGAKNATFVVKDNKIVIRIEYTSKQIAGPDGQLSPVTTGTSIYTIVFGTKPASQTTSNN